MAAEQSLADGARLSANNQPERDGRPGQLISYIVLLVWISCLICLEQFSYLSGSVVICLDQFSYLSGAVFMFVWISCHICLDQL